jgi:hypothetical protein
MASLAAEARFGIIVCFKNSIPAPDRSTPKTWAGGTHGQIKHLAVGILLALPCFPAILSGSESPQLLTKSFHPASQKIPLIMYQPDSGKMTLDWVKLRWDNMAASNDKNDTLLFQFDHQGEDILFNSFRSELWISALASGIAWQQPWLAAKWTVTEVPTGDVSGNGAALGIALIATASRTLYPQNTVVLGRLNPDGSLGQVPHMSSRVEAAAAAGIKRILIPNLQRFEITPEGEIFNIPALAAKLGMECILVDDLIEATEVLLNKKLPPAAGLEASPRYSSGLFEILEAKVRIELEQLNVRNKSWPRSAAQLGALPLPEQTQWLRIFRNYDTGLDAYHAGQLYTARQLLRQAHAGLDGLTEIKNAGQKFDYAAFDARANAIRGKMVDRLNQPSIDKNELQSALVLAEESDWISRLNARIQGAQIIARQAFDPRSDATPQQQLVAQNLLISTVKGGEYQMEDKSFYPDLYQLMASQDEVSVYNRASILWPQLLPAQLGKAEYFILGLKSRANELGGSLLFDAQLSSFVHGLKDSQMAWEQRGRDMTRLARKEQPRVLKVGFIPGAGYSTPKPPVPPLPVNSLSDAVRCLSWVNEYCEVAILEQKYLYLDGTFDTNSSQWKVRNRIALENMLQFADLGARRGIAFAESVGADSSVLKVIYETGSNYRASEDNNIRLEALRQYWRCALLGSMCWQLSFSPRATLQPADTAPAPKPSATPETPKPAPGPVSSVSNTPESVTPPLVSTPPSP